MNPSQFIRGGGILMMISGLALGYSYITHPQQMPPEVIASTSWVVIHLLFAVSLVLGLLGTTALYAATATRCGWPGLVGFLLVFPGMMLIFGLDYYEFLIAPFLAQRYPAVIVDYGPGDTMGWIALAFPLAGMLTVVGYALLGWAWKKLRALPDTIAIGLIVTSIAFGIGLSPLGGLMVARITATLFGLALILVGLSALRRPADFLRDDETAPRS